MRKQIMAGIAALTLVAALTGCSSAGKETAAAPAAGAKPAAASDAGNSGETVVNLKNTKFDKQRLEIKAGTTVKWVNQDTVDHSIWEGEPDSGKHRIKSEDFSTGKSFTHKFDQPGTYEIFCNTGAHHLLGMKMQVVVK